MPQHQDAVQFRAAGDARTKSTPRRCNSCASSPASTSRRRPMPRRSTARSRKSPPPPGGCWLRCIPMRRRATARSRPRRRGSARGCGSAEASDGSAPGVMHPVTSCPCACASSFSCDRRRLRPSSGVIDMLGRRQRVAFSSFALGGFPLAHAPVIFPGIEHQIAATASLFDRRQLAGRTGFAARTGRPAARACPRAGFAARALRRVCPADRLRRACPADRACLAGPLCRADLRVRAVRDGLAGRGVPARPACRAGRAVPVVPAGLMCRRPMGCSAENTESVFSRVG